MTGRATWRRLAERFPLPWEPALQAGGSAHPQQPAGLLAAAPDCEARRPLGAESRSAGALTPRSPWAPPRIWKRKQHPGRPTPPTSQTKAAALAGPPFGG